MPAGEPTVDDLRGYLDLQRQPNAQETAFFERALASALLFAARYTGRTFDVLPVDYVDAVLTVAARRYLERNAGYGDRVLDDGGGGAATWVRQLPASAKLILDSYRVPGVA